MKTRRKNSMLGNMIGMGVGTLVGTGLIGASAGEVNKLSAGTAKTLAGTAVGLQGVALVGHNLGYVRRSMKKTKFI